MYSSMWSLLVLFVSCGIGDVTSENTTCPSNKVLNNFIIKDELYSLKMNLIKYSKPYLHILQKFSVPSSDGSNLSTTLQNTKLYNLTLVELNGDAFFWTVPNNIKLSTYSITLAQMNITVGSLHYLGKTYSNQKITLDNVVLNVGTSTVFAATSCSQKFTDLKVQTVKQAIWNKNSSITSYVNSDIVPFINRFLNSNHGMNLTDKYFNKCNYNASNNLISLLEEPYASGGSNLFPLTTITILAFFYLVKFSV